MLHRPIIYIFQLGEKQTIEMTDLFHFARQAKLRSRVVQCSWFSLMDGISKNDLTQNGNGVYNRSRIFHPSKLVFFLCQFSDNQIALLQICDGQNCININICTNI